MITMPAQGWKPRNYQIPCLKHMLPDTPSLRAILAWHRRAGKDLLSVNIAAMKSLQRVGTYWYVFPFQNQGRRIIWDGIDGQGKKFIDAWPKDLVARKNEAEMRLHLKNGSVVQMFGADNPDKAVGANPVGIVFSEFSLCNPDIWTLTNPMLAENGGWALFNGTPRGENHFYTMLERAKASSDWYWSHLSAMDTRAISPEALRRARNEMNNEARFQSEFMCSFRTPVEGAYYGEVITRLYEKEQIVDRIPPDPKLPVITGWDLGMDDATSIWFAQRFKHEMRLLHYYENSGEGLAHYANYIDRWAATNGVTYGEHYAPHDIKVREMGTGKSRFEIARGLGLRFRIARKLPVQDGIEAVRGLLPTCWIASKTCHLGLEGLKGYRKEFSEKREVFGARPVHDKHSHPADALRTLAVGLRSTTSGHMVPKNLQEYEPPRITY